MLKPKNLCVALILAVMMALVGCDRDSERLVQLSEQSVSRQAEQNRQIAHQSQQTAEATRSLVEADARARGELIEAQRSLENGIHDERARLDQQRQELEQHRQELAAAREREPVIAQAIGAAALLLAVLLPVVLCVYLLRAASVSPAERDLSELLVRELTAEQPLFLLPTAAPPREQLPAPMENQDL